MNVLRSVGKCHCFEQTELRRPLVDVCNVVFRKPTFRLTARVLSVLEHHECVAVDSFLVFPNIRAATQQPENKVPQQRSEKEKQNLIQFRQSVNDQMRA